MEWNPIDVQQATVFFELLLALILGMSLGLERSIVGKRAGMRTFALVAVGSCLFVIVSELVAQGYIGVTNIDPLRMASSIITGIGFLGAGIIIFDKELKGLTTAASLWVTAGIGCAVGFGLYGVAVFTALITLFVFEILWHVEQYASRHVRIPKKREQTVMVDMDNSRHTK